MFINYHLSNTVLVTCFCVQFKDQENRTQTTLMLSACELFIVAHNKSASLFAPLSIQNAQLTLSFSLSSPLPSCQQMSLTPQSEQSWWWVKIAWPIPHFNCYHTDENPLTHFTLAVLYILILRWKVIALAVDSLYCDDLELRSARNGHKETIYCFKIDVKHILRCHMHKGLKTTKGPLFLVWLTLLFIAIQTQANIQPQATVATELSALALHSGFGSGPDK